MGAMEIALFLSIGLTAGVLSGLFGIGGGTVIVPALILMTKMTQLKAQGTSLAVLLLPVGLLGVMQYWNTKNVDVRATAILAAGFLIGILGGSKIAIQLDPVLMRRLFAGFLVVVAAQLAFKG